MKICPKCKESIGDDIKDCPFCQYHFTQEDFENLKREKQELEEGIARQIEEKRAARAKKRLIYSIVMMCAYILPYVIGASLVSLTKDLTIFIVVAFVGVAAGTAVLAAGCISGAYRCPYCERILFRNYGKHCVHCGKQLYY